MSEARRDPSTIFDEALRRTDPVERAAYLEVACGDDMPLRREVEGQLVDAGEPGPISGPVTREMSWLAPTIEGTISGPAETVDSAEVIRESGSESTRTSDSSDRRDTDSPAVNRGLAETEAFEPGDGHVGHPGRFVPGRVIADRYKLLEVLGEGGMGTVYRAEQFEPVRRTVALKLIKYGYDSRGVAARFDAERQALALMEHPNIARVYDGGTTAEGQPFFAMEYVEGTSITRFCDGRRLPLQGRLELFLAVCQAVQHAHQKGIIHRDLKPGNVLVTEVDGRPTPKVIDFGVAKATEFELTELSVDDTGAIVGTPTYMSPEQADPSSMDIDTRTDVYSLGVILYELLVGSTPLELQRTRRGGALEMLRMIREVDPPKPSTKLGSSENAPGIAANRNIDPDRLAWSLRGELDWIAMKALEKDRERRYATVNALARDIQRFLADEVVEARPPSAGYRLKKFLRRHRAQAIAAGLVLVALLAGIVGTAIGLLRAEEQRQVAERRLGQLSAATRETQRQRDRAERNFATARTLILDMGSRINQIETGQPNPLLADRARREALDKAREQFQRFLAESPKDEPVKMQTAILHRYAANVSRFMSDNAAAETSYAAAIRLLEDLAKQVPGNSVYRNELALALLDRAALETMMGRLSEAGSTLDQALGLLDGTPISGTETPYHRTLALGLIEMEQSKVAYQRGRFEKSLDHASRSAKLLDSLKSAPPSERITVETLFAAKANKRRANALFELGKTPEALAGLEEAFAKLKEPGPIAPATDLLFEECESRRDRARMASAIAERRPEALEELGEVIGLAEKLATDHPQVAFYQQGLVDDYLCRAEILTQQGRLEPAKGDLERALAISKNLLKRLGRLSDSLWVRGRVYLALGRASIDKPAVAAGHRRSAAEDFDAALKLDPDNFHLRKGLEEARRADVPPG